MLNKIKTNFNKEELINSFPKNGKTINVSFFHKFKKYSDLKGKKFTVVDFEFSTDQQIFEMAFFDVIDGKISNYAFKEFQLPVGTLYFNIELNRIVRSGKSFNIGKDILTDKMKQYIIHRMENCDYLVTHNYTAELQCYMKIKYPSQKYSTDKIKMYQENKIICTRYSFNKKYFSNKHFLQSQANGAISTFMNWGIKIENKNSTELNFKIQNKNPRLNENHIVKKKVFSKEKATYHNAMYDIFITLTNLKSLEFLLKD